MAITELFVDPAIAGNSGAGTVGSPYGDLEWLLSQETFDTTNGHRINIKSGTAEILSAALNLAANFTSGGGPSAAAPLIFRGYATAAGDSSWLNQTGIGGIDCNNKSLFSVATHNFIALEHLEIFGRAGAGYAALIDVNQHCLISECEIHTHSGTGEMCRNGGHSVTRRCHFHTLSSSVNCCVSDSTGEWLENYVNISSGNIAIALTGTGGRVRRNIIRVSGAVDGIFTASGCKAESNSVWSDGGTGQGIRGTGGNVSVINNVVEGFSGAGGIGIEQTGSMNEYGGNHVFNCATSYSVSVPIMRDYGDNEDLSGSSPFVSASGQDFTPANVGNMREGAFPPSILAADDGLTAVMKMWKGALEPAAGRLLIHPGTSGGARG